ncbi:MAG: 4-aminobutyrate--2-oxoglutarate transaminase, partial [Bacillus sp. (in: Bacteria)]|nr:4-aminobutyrate--2-oxoglutarate transaminase [Bacillus sp. (in: firmicutes)]
MIKTNSIELKTAIPGPKAIELLNKRMEHVPQGPFNTVLSFVEKAEGALVTDVDGNRFIDFAGGIG